MTQYKHISIGKFRGLQQVSSKRGTFTALALDHRQNLRKANPAFVDTERLAFLTSTGQSRLSRLTLLCQTLAKPYTDFYAASALFDWCHTY